MNIGMSSRRGLRGIGAAFFVQRLQTLAELEPDPLTAVTSRQVGYVGLRAAHDIRDLTLGQTGFDDVGDDGLPHEPDDSICCCEPQQRQHPLVQHLLLRDYAAGMNIEDVRRLKLRQWIDTDPASMGDVEAWCSYYSKFAAAGENTLSPTYIRQLVPKRGRAGRNIGERTARRLERIGRKPKGWLDEEPSTGEAIAGEDESSTPSTAVNCEEPPARWNVTRNSTENAALAVHIDAIWQSAKVVAEAFGMRTEQILEAAMKPRRRIQPPESPDDEVMERRTFRGGLGISPPELRPVMREERHYYPSLVDPYAEPPAETQRPTAKERRG